MHVVQVVAVASWVFVPLVASETHGFGAQAGGGEFFAVGEVLLGLDHLAC